MTDNKEPQTPGQTMGDVEQSEEKKSETEAATSSAPSRFKQSGKGKKTQTKKATKQKETSSFMEVKTEPVRTAILNSRPPYCAGTLSLRPEDLVVFFGKDSESHGRIDFGNTNDTELERLANICDKATFGRGSEDVFDESYRKAGKLDTSYFATKIDPDRSGLMDIVRYNLLDGNAGRRPIKAELYKLNVYDKDSFFKPHKDTPRGISMFGTLVIILPTIHEGGALILRHNDKEWTFDSAEEIGSTKNVGYATFFSDVEHEVTLVKSGYRVTITYNLYYDDDTSTPQTVELPKALPMNGHVVKDAIQALLEDKAFYPKGIHLGFGLNHEYPIEVKSKCTDNFDCIAENLKGSDALIMQACKDLNLDAKLYISYTYKTSSELYEIIVPKMLKLDDKFFMEGERTFDQYLTENGGKVVDFRTRYPEYYKFKEEIDFRVHWVTEKTDFNKQKSTFMAYGNESEMEHAYGRFCLIVKIGPARNRASVKQGDA